MEFTGNKLGKYYILDAAGRLDATTSQEFEEQCNTWLSLGEKRIVVDMSAVEYISSAGLRSILASAKKTRAVGGDLYFCGLKGMVAEVFKLSGFATLFSIFYTREQAVNGRIKGNE